MFWSLLTSNCYIGSPSPDSYRVISDFDPGQSVVSTKKAFTFGVSREAYDKVYIPSQKISVEKNLPGPGQYTLLSSIGYEGRKYSLQGRTPYYKGKNDKLLKC